MMREKKGYGLRRDGFMLRSNWEVRGVYVRNRGVRTIDEIREILKRWEEESGMMLFDEIDGKLYWMGSEREFQMYVKYEERYSRGIPGLIRVR